MGVSAKLDPGPAREAKVAGFEQHFNQLTTQVAKIRVDTNREKAEADAIGVRYNALVSAAELLQKKADAASEPQKSELNASLEKLLGQIEELAPEMDREKKEAEDAVAFLHEFEKAAEEAATKLKSARSQLANAKRDMERASLEKDRAHEHAEQAAVLSGVRSQTDSFGVALSAMQKKAQADRQAADASNLKAQLLSKPAPDELKDDHNIAQALAEVTDIKPKLSATERLAALKRRSEPVAA